VDAHAWRAAAIHAVAIAVLIAGFVLSNGWLFVAGVLLEVVASSYTVSALRSHAGAMRSVAAGARRMAAGDLTVRVEGGAGGDAEALANVLNGMAASLRDIIGDLSAERDKLSAVLDTMADGVVMVDAADRVTLINPAARGLLGAPARAMAPGANGHARFSELAHDHELVELVSRSRARRERQTAQLELLRGRRHLSAIATPLSGENTGAVLLTFHDLSRSRQVDTTRREFVTNVSHELRSPLASIKAMVETLEGGALDDRQAAGDFLRRIHQEVDRMVEMVEGLLELARVESGQTELRMTAVDMVALAEEARSAMQARAEAAGIAIDVSSTGRCGATGDAAKLRQVLVNLLDNALKFTPGGGRIVVTLGMQNDSVRVEVSDTGRGIATEHLPHVFERFYKVDRSRRDGGTGLGLAIARHIVEAHGGTIGVESAVGTGSTFRFTVPAAPPER